MKKAVYLFDTAITPNKKICYNPHAKATTTVAVNKITLRIGQATNQ
jgi:hypothetical protein